MYDNSIKKVVIAGGGTAGWMAAAALSKKLQGLIEVVLVESEEIGTVGVGEATIPPIRAFHKILGIDEQEFMRETSATFKLGISFENWKEIGDEYIHSFGRTGTGGWACQFVHFWLHGLKHGFQDGFGEYCYELQAARQGKFATSSKSEISYAYHLDATLYAKYLKSFSQAHGLKRIEGKIQKIGQNSSTGYIESLTLDSGLVVDGDLFIDCTGFKGLLIEQTLHTGYEDWSHWLLCDSAIAVQTESSGPAKPYTRSIAREAGWQWRIPLQHRTGNGLVYSSRYMSDGSARAQLLSNLDGEPITDPRVIKYRTGRRLKAWNKNCLALGLSSGFIEPLESTSIYLFLIGVSRLIQMFPFSGIAPSIVDEYNAQTNRELENIRDFIILHYKVTNRDDSAFWRHCRGMSIPESLEHRIEMFKRSAHLFLRQDELFRADSWYQVMLGQGILPEDYHKIASTMTERELESLFSDIKGKISQVVRRMPTHQDFLDQYCPSTVLQKKQMV